MRTEEIILRIIDDTFRAAEARLPSKPILVDMNDRLAYRFQEKSNDQAIIQKLALAQSSLRAAKLLLENGFLIEQAILHRVNEEANEDILFLAFAVTNKEQTDLHEKFLAAFWEEEIDKSGDAIKSKQKRPMVSRKKIRAYIANNCGDSDPSTHIELMRTIAKAYSGFVHGASPQLMDLCEGIPPKFKTNGMLDSPKIEDYIDDWRNYAYRTFHSHMFVAKIFGLEDRVAIMSQYENDFLEWASQV